jgi:DtxR family Mn-dependent transcriptional regulator
MRRKTIEEYIETIHMLEKRDGIAHMSEIASLMNVKPPSVTEMIRKLDKEGLVKYKRYEGAKLTKRGLKLAKELMKKHRTIAEFLIMIGVDEKYADIDACQIEHHVSKNTMEKLVKFVDLVHSAPKDAKWVQQFKK